MVENKISGIIENVSTKNRGMKINGLWYNYRGDVDKYCTEIRKDDNVEITANEKNYIISIKKLGEEHPTTAPEEYVSNKRVQKINTIINDNHGLLDDQYNMFAAEREVFATQTTQWFNNNENKTYHKVVIFYWEEKK